MKWLTRKVAAHKKISLYFNNLGDSFEILKCDERRRFASQEQTRDWPQPPARFTSIAQDRGLCIVGP